MANRVFIGNVPFDVTEADLRELFKIVGKIKQVVIPKDRETGKPRGFAFIEFETHSQMLDAISRFNNAMLKERKLSVCEAKKKEDNKPKPKSEDNSSIEPSVIWEDEETGFQKEKKQRKEVDFESSSKAKKKILAELEEKGSKIRHKGGKFIGLEDEEEDDDDFVPVYMKEPSQKEE